MDHSEAIRLAAADKYLLGELPSQQRDAFEEHFFTCLECADAVKSGAVFLDNAQRIFREEPATQTVLRPVAVRQGWFGWFRPALGWAAVLALVGVISYQNFVTIPSLRQNTIRPEALTSFSLLTAASRGGETTVIHAPHGRPFGIYVDIPAAQSFPYYTLDLRTGTRNVMVQVSAEQAKDTVQMLIPAGAVQSGRAELVIEGQASQNGAPTKVASYPFAIQVQ